MKIGYARVSTKEQNLAMQLDALQSEGCERIYSEKVSAVKCRPEFEKMMESLRNGDILVLWALDRLHRDSDQSNQILKQLTVRGVCIKSLKEGVTISPSSPAMEIFLFRIMSASAELERLRGRERSIDGQASARNRGAIIGRPPGLTKRAKEKAAAALGYYQKGLTISEIARRLDIQRSTAYKYLRYMGIDLGKKDEVKSVPASKTKEENIKIPAGLTLKGQKRASAIRELFQKGMKVTKIAKELNVQRATVYSYLHRMGLDLSKK